jgi:hypothetical protein
MSDKPLSFKILPCPMDIGSPHTDLVVSGRGIPHEPLTLFYEELQKSCTPETLHSLMSPLLSYFSFLEEPQSLCNGTFPCIQEEWSSCMEIMKVPSIPPGMAWAAPPSELQAVIRFYLAARWGCRTRQQGQYEHIRLSPTMREGQQLHLFLATLQRFYRFVIERQDYWYERNPAGAFRLPLGTRLLQVIAHMGLSQRSHLVGHQRNVGEVLEGRAGQAVREPQDKVPVLARSGTALGGVQTWEMGDNLASSLLTHFSPVISTGHNPDRSTFLEKAPFEGFYSHLPRPAHGMLLHPHLA